MLRLDRFSEVTDEDGRPAATLGWLNIVDNAGDVSWFCAALELPWRENENNISRIPDGRYIAEVVEESPAFDYEHVWLHDEGSVYAAGDRSGLKIHIANFARQLDGCVAVGKRFVDIDGDGVLDVTESESTLQELVDRIPQKTELHAHTWPVEKVTPAAVSTPPHPESLDLDVSLSPISNGS